MRCPHCESADTRARVTGQRTALLTKLLNIASGDLSDSGSDRLCRSISTESMDMENVRKVV